MESINTLISSTTASGVTSITDAGIQLFQTQFLWAIIVGFVLAFLLGFGMGANDVVGESQSIIS
jgi:hypothetical protein